MLNTIGFLVKKPAQFDVPFFRHISSQKNTRWRLVVIYLENPEQPIHDQELKASSNWGINLTEGYVWHFLETVTSKCAIEALYQQLKIDLLISNGYQAKYASFISVAKALKIPIGLRIDSVLTGKSAGSLLIRKWVMRWTYRHFAGFFTTGKMGFAYLDYIGIAKKKQFWFPYCSDNEFFGAGNGKDANTGKFRMNYGLDPHKSILLGVCKFIARENPADLLEAFIALNDSQLQLVMIGDGDQATDLKNRASLYPQLSIFFPGYVPYIELPHWYAIAKVFVHPAQDEPWGVSVQEALAAGCRVVASDKVGSAFDLIVSGKNGFIYPVNSPQVLARAMQNALSLPEALVVETNAAVLDKWNYAAVWQSMQEAACRIVG